MLGLGDHIGSHIFRISVFIRDDEDLAWTGDHIDVDLAVDQALGTGDIRISRPDDFIHARDALGAISEGSHGLCTADLADAGHAGDMRGGRNDRIYAAIC